MAASFKACDYGNDCERTLLGTFVSALGVGMCIEAHMCLYTHRPSHVQLALSPFHQPRALFSLSGSRWVLAVYRYSWAGSRSPP